MTVATNVNRNDYTGNGAVDTYGYTFRILDDDDLLVQVQNTSGTITTLTKTTDYTVSGVGVYAGGNVVLVNNSQAWLTAGKLTTGYKISIRRRMDLLQPTDLRNRGSFYPETHETVFDRLVMYDQQQQDEINRALKFPQTDGTSLTTELPAASVRASKYLAFDSLGNAIASGGGPGSIPINAYWEGIVDEANLANSLTAMGISSDMRAFLATANDAAARTELGAAAKIDRAFVYNSVNHSIIAGGYTLTFDTEIQDTATLHSTSVNTSRMTVPAGYTLAKLKGQVSIAANATGTRSLSLLKNGSTTTPSILAQQPVASGSYSSKLQIETPWLVVTPGDYFELSAGQDSGGTLTGFGSETWFSIEVSN